MAMIGILFIGVVIILSLIAGLFIIATVLSLIITFISFMTAPPSMGKSEKFIKSIKVFIASFSAVTSLVFGVIFCYSLTAMKILNNYGQSPVFYILFAAAGLVLGLLCAAAVNKILVDPVIRFINRFRNPDGTLDSKK